MDDVDDDVDDDADARQCTDAPTSSTMRNHTPARGYAVIQRPRCG